MEPELFQRLTPTERAKHIALSRLKKHFVALEDSGLMSQETATKYIGSVRVLEAMIDGDFVEH